MAALDNGRDGTHRRAGISIVVGAGLFAGLALVSFGSSPVAVADTLTVTGSVELASLPATAPIELDQFDPASGTLDAITVVATLGGNVDAEVFNLTDAPKATTVRFDSSANSRGPGGVDLTVTIEDTTTEVLQPDTPRSFDLTASGEQSTSVTDPAALAPFVGTGTVRFEVDGFVDVNVSGPAAWRTRGVANALATITIEYDFTTESPTTTSTTTTTTVPESTTTTTTTTVPETTTTTTTPETTTTTVPETTTTTTTTSTTTTTTTTIPETTTTTSTTTTTIPETTTTTSTTSTTTTTTIPETTTTTTVAEPVCVQAKLGPPLAEGDYSAGPFTVSVTDLRDTPTGGEMDWTATGAVQWINFNELPPAPPFDAVYDLPVFSGTAATIGDDPGVALQFLHVVLCDR